MLVLPPDVNAIDRSGPLPYYYQLKQILLAEIDRRKLVPGDKIPGDHELCEVYGVSRTVVRQALLELEASGVVERMKGRGTFIAQQKTAEGLVQSLTGLHEDVLARGSSLRSEVRYLEVVPADDRIADALQIPPATSVVHLERLRFIGEIPWVLTITYLPFTLAPGLVNEDMSSQSLYRLLEDKYGVQLKRGRRAVEATTADSDMANSLGINKGAPLLVLHSTSYGMDDKPVEVFVAYHRGDRSRFEVELTRNSSTPSRPLMLMTD